MCGSKDIPCPSALEILVSVLAQSVLWGVQASLQTHLFPEVLTPLGFLDQFSSSLFVPWVLCREEGGPQELFLEASQIFH